METHEEKRNDHFIRSTQNKRYRYVKEIPRIIDIEQVIHWSRSQQVQSNVGDDRDKCSKCHEADSKR